MVLSELDRNQRIYLSVLVIAIGFIYYKYYGNLHFGDASPFTNPKGYVPSTLPDGSTVETGLIIPGYEDHALKFFIIHGLPFFIATLIFKDWRFKQSFVMSYSVWAAVFFYCATVRFHEFLRMYPDTYQCGATLVTTYTLMGLSMVLGTWSGRFARFLIQSRPER
ncbi:MAG: hypothetical protein ACOVS5_02645 [Oligoflexus sp.]